MKTQLRSISISLFFCLILFCRGTASASSLTTTISLYAKDESLQDVLKKIETLADVKIMYNSKILHNHSPITVNIRSITVRSALQTIINDSDLLFYELDKYIVITQRRDVPNGVIFQQAVLDPTITETRRAINDTFQFFDTLRISDTVRVLIFDTLHIVDTIQIRTDKSKEVASNNRSTLMISAEFMTAYQMMAGLSTDKPQASFSSQTMVHRKCKNWSCGFGVGYFIQRGGSRKQTTVITRDSLRNKSSETVVHKYPSGTYYYVQNGDTVPIIVYDSVTVTVPYEWFDYTINSTTSVQDYRYNISWLSLPLRIEFLTDSPKHINAGISLTVSPSISVFSNGQIVASDGSIKEVNRNYIQSFTVFASIAPIVSINLNRQAKFFVSPTIQSSLSTVFKHNPSLSVAAGLNAGISFKL